MSRIAQCRKSGWFLCGSRRRGKLPMGSRNMRSEPVASAGVILEREPHRDGHEEAGHQQEDVGFHQPSPARHIHYQEKPAGPKGALPAAPV
jgi:hypothetical protein